jgi:PIN domain nuclease of toxin-antitoxin system
MNEAEERLISTATTWEVVIKSALGKVRLGVPIGDTRPPSRSWNRLIEIRSTVC